MGIEICEASGLLIPFGITYAEIPSALKEMGAQRRTIGPGEIINIVLPQDESTVHRLIVDRDGKGVYGRLPWWVLTDKATPVFQQFTGFCPIYLPESRKQLYLGLRAVRVEGFQGVSQHFLMLDFGIFYTTESRFFHSLNYFPGRFVS